MPSSSDLGPDDGRLWLAVKRVRERWLADPGFRAAIGADPSRLQAEYPAVDPDGLRFLWTGEGQQDSAEAATFRQIDEWLGGYTRFCRDPAALADSDRRYRAWRERQIARCAFALGPAAAVNPHLPFAVELSAGCSVGCWFCGLSAPRLRANFPADADGLALWRGCLDVLAARFGDFARRGMLFWATDPLDNPNYEQFADAFADRLGAWPTTTTALPLRDLARTRRLLQRARARGTPRSRFSILTVRMLADIHAAFAPEELRDVDLVPVNKGSLLGLAVAGRVHAASDGRVGAQRDKLPDGVRHDTIACVSGFLIDMPARRLRLVTPVRSGPARPDGYAVLDEAVFDDANAFGAAMDTMIGRHMQIEPPPDTALVLPDMLELQPCPDGVAVSANGHSARFTRRGHSAHLPRLLAGFGDGRRIGDVVDSLAAAAPRPTLLRDVAVFRQAGVLVEHAMREPR